MAIEERFDVPFVAAQALREKQIQQNHRPVIAVHKWFARRPGTLFRALLLAEFGAGSLREEFFRSHDFAGRRVADPFMGGGIPVLEANRMGCDVVGLDISPMSYWIVREEIERVDLDAYNAAAQKLVKHLQSRVGELYSTRCDKCGSNDAEVKYFLWVKRQRCERCAVTFDLFPGYLLAGSGRHPRNVVVCRGCGALTEVASLSKPGNCHSCRAKLCLDGTTRQRRCTCPGCGHVQKYPSADAAPPEHRLFAIEYHCEACKPSHQGRFFKAASAEDLARCEKAARRLGGLEPRFIPDDEIHPGDETNRLLRWGYRRFRDLFNPRQLLGLELSARWIARCGDQRVQRALTTNFSDLLRYQNMVCRYDTAALKSLDIFSIHGFPVGLVQCESNILGIRTAAGGCVGSGGWGNIIGKYTKAKAFCDNPFELRIRGGRKSVVPTPGEWIGERRSSQASRDVRIECADAAAARLPPRSLDAVFTDPPYFGNVQYAELMEFCYAWLRRLASFDPAVAKPTLRDRAELTANVTQSRGVDHFTDGLSRVFTSMCAALKPGAPLAFTYHHNKLSAYLPIVVAILDADMVCTRAIPCPAEMGGSIHINGNQSSIVDSVLVCRARGARLDDLPNDAKQVARLVRADLADLLDGGVRASLGDTHCIICGQLARAAIARLSHDWDRSAPVPERLRRAAEALERGIEAGAVKQALERIGPPCHSRRLPLFDELDAEAEELARCPLARQADSHESEQAA